MDAFDIDLSAPPLRSQEICTLELILAYNKVE